MKYMGSKRAMLGRGLGDILKGASEGKLRFFDLFSGSGSVSHYIAENTALEVNARDLQLFASSLAASVIGRTQAIQADDVWAEWDRDAQVMLANHPMLTEATRLQTAEWLSKPIETVDAARILSASVSDCPITHAYGGHYFSPVQALTLDAYRKCIDDEDAWRDLKIASLLAAASECSASPGHTAQPFQPTGRGSRFLFESWNREVRPRTKRRLMDLGLRHAVIQGNATVADAVTAVGDIGDRDIAFVDPPYSDVQYSRFYHVLETVAVGKTSSVSGVGRYPDKSLRPQSPFSRRSDSASALTSLMSSLSHSGARTVVTYPNGPTSNGLSGEFVIQVAEDFFTVESYLINGMFSTLGGNVKNRAARVPSYELVLVLEPR